MKTTLFGTLFAAALIANSLAATYTFNNGSGSTATGITDKDGNAFRGGTTAGTVFTGAAGGVSAGPGIVSVGIFSTDTLQSVTDSATLISLFTNFGGTGNSFSAAGATGNRSLYTIGAPNVVITGNATFADKFIYLFAGNGTTLANSTQFAVLKSASKFLASDDGIPTGVTVTFTDLNSSILFGTTSPNVLTASTDGSTNPGFAMKAVPEPSAALLGAIGALGLLRRRRN